MDPDTLKGKLLFSVVDKLLVGVAAGLVVLLFQSRQEKRDLIHQEVIAASRVVTTALADEQTKLMVHVSALADFTNTLKSAGQAREEDAEELRKREADVLRSVRALKAIDRARNRQQGGGPCQYDESYPPTKLSDSIRDLTGPLLSESLNQRQIEERLEDVQLSYTQLLDFVRCLAVNTIRREVKDVQKG